MNAADLLGALMGGMGGGGSRAISARFRCYSVAHLGRPELEEGDKAVLCASFFERLSSAEVQYPMQFQAVNESLGTTTHVGVLEFTAEEGALGGAAAARHVARAQFRRSAWRLSHPLSPSHPPLQAAHTCRTG